MTYGDVIAILPNILKKYYRKYESIKKKIIDYKWSMTFNKVCIKNNLWPTFTNLNKKQRFAKNIILCTISIFMTIYFSGKNKLKI